jgi:hypothetical protein
MNYYTGNTSNISVGYMNPYTKWMLHYYGHTDIRGCYDQNGTKK